MSAGVMHRSQPVESDSEVCEAFEARRKMEDTINGVRSQTRAQLYTFSPAEFESTPTGSVRVK